MAPRPACSTRGLGRTGSPSYAGRGECSSREFCLVTYCFAMTHDDPDMVEGPYSRGALAARLARSAPATLLYGAIVAAMAMALAAAHAQVAWRVVIGTSIVLLVYWVAHVYVHTIGERLAEPGLSLPRRAAESIHDEAPLLVGGLPTFVVFMLLTLFGLDISAARLRRAVVHRRPTRRGRLPRWLHGRHPRMAPGG